MLLINELWKFMLQVMHYYYKFQEISIHGGKHDLIYFMRDISTSAQGSLWVISSAMDRITKHRVTIYLVTTMLATSKIILFPGHNHLLTTSTDDLHFWLSIIKVESHQCRWLVGGYNLEIGHLFKGVWLYWSQVYIRVPSHCHKDNKHTLINPYSAEFLKLY